VNYLQLIYFIIYVKYFVTAS